MCLFGSIIWISPNGHRDHGTAVYVPCKTRIDHESGASTLGCLVKWEYTLQVDMRRFSMDANGNWDQDLATHAEAIIIFKSRICGNLPWYQSEPNDEMRMENSVEICTIGERRDGTYVYL